jgi:hypothetical protein
MLKLVDNQNTQHPPVPAQQPEPPIEQSPLQDVPLVPQITLSAEDRADVHANTVIKRMVIVLAIIVVVLTIGTWSFIASVQKTAQDAKAAKQSSKNTTTSKSSSNPLNNNGSVNSDVKYCSNVVNGSLYC